MVREKANAVPVDCSRTFLSARTPQMKTGIRNMNTKSQKCSAAIDPLVKDIGTGNGSNEMLFVRHGEGGKSTGYRT